ncbi:MAG: ATP-binding protein [Desulfobulbaceae bacterium]|nr:ATP-binding protein [Desulfobulbaceae bacterium]HIJ89755.1 response regulator [Deltaproteobacteria bacterium]
MKTRLTLAISLLFLCLMGATSFLVLTLFKQQIKGIISTEQFSILSEITGSLDDMLLQAQSQLVAVAPKVTQETLASADMAQQFLDNRTGLQKSFDNHIFLFSPEGKIIAESPFLPNRRGLDLSFRAYIKDTLATSAPVICDPYISSQPHKHPVIMMTAPVFGREGKIIAILAGSIDLMRPNILGKLSEKKIGKTGYLYLTTSDRTMIMHPDKGRIFKKIPEGKNPLLDRAVAGFEGTAENRSREGVPMLTSVKRSRVNNWLLLANYPQAELFAPITRAGQILLAGMLVITLAAFAVIRHFSQYLTKPLLAFTQHVAELENKQGEARLFRTTAQDESGTLAQAFNTMLKKLDRQQDELRQSEELYRTVTEFATDFIFWRSPDKKMIFVSQNCAQLTGYSEDEFLADPGLLDQIFHPEDRQRWATHVHPTDRSGKETPLEFRITTKAGQVRWVSHVCTKIHDARGRFLGLRGNLADISNLKQAAEEQEKLRNLLAQAQKMESIGILAGGVAHDFNNILSIILGYSELLLLELDETSPAREKVQVIADAGQRASTLTRQLLAFSRKQTIQLLPCSLNQIILDLIKMLTRMIGEDISMEIRATAKDDTVLIDPGQMEQVLLNMAVNARDAMPTGGSLIIETENGKLDAEHARPHEGVKPGQYVVLSVRDTGQGMSREIQANIFDPFFTTKERGRGTGLGLAMVYGIVKQLGGHIFVYSVPEQGTTFKIFLPVAQGMIEKTPASPTLSLPTGTDTILVVDDEPSLKSLVTDILSPLGYTMLQAGSGTEAIQVSNAFPGRIDILLTDVIMPGMNGRELAEAITTRRPETRVIYMSGYTDSALAHHGVLDPGIILIEKPITPDKLTGVLEATRVKTSETAGA